MNKDNNASTIRPFDASTSSASEAQGAKAQGTKLNNNMEQQILQCAEELFLEKGFSLVSTTDIAKKAGCNQALVHYYFRTKENLFQQIFQAKFTKFLYIFTTFDDSDDDFTTRLRKKIEAHFDLLIENRQIPFLVINELILNEERRNALVKRIYSGNLEIYRNFDRELQEEIQKGNIREITTLNLLINVVSMNIVSFLMLPILESQFDFDDDEIVEFLERRKKESVTTIMNSIVIRHKEEAK